MGRKFAAIIAWGRQGVNGVIDIRYSASMLLMSMTLPREVVGHGIKEHIDNTC